MKFTVYALPQPHLVQSPSSVSPSPSPSSKGHQDHLSLPPVHSPPLVSSSHQGCSNTSNRTCNIILCLKWNTVERENLASIKFGELVYENILVSFKFGDDRYQWPFSACQIAKLKTSPNFPAIVSV